MQVEKDYIDLADKNTMGAYGQLNNSIQQAKTLYGNVNSAIKNLDEAKRGNPRWKTDPIIKAEIEKQEAEIKRMQGDANYFRDQADLMANNIQGQGQNRYGYVNDAVKGWQDYRKLLSQEQEPVISNTETKPEIEISDVLTFTPEQSKIINLANSHKQNSEITEGNVIEFLQKNKIPLTQANIDEAFKRLKEQAAANKGNTIFQAQQAATAASYKAAILSGEISKTQVSTELAGLKAATSGLENALTKSDDFIMDFLNKNADKLGVSFMGIKAKFGIGSSEGSRAAAKEELKIKLSENKTKISGLEEALKAVGVNVGNNGNGEKISDIIGGDNNQNDGNNKINTTNTPKRRKV
jgi:hypothetical protein